MCVCIYFSLPPSTVPFLFTSPARFASLSHSHSTLDGPHPRIVGWRGTPCGTTSPTLSYDAPSIPCPASSSPVSFFLSRLEYIPTSQEKRESLLWRDQYDRTAHASASLYLNPSPLLGPSSLSQFSSFHRRHTLLFRVAASQSNVAAKRRSSSSLADYVPDVYPSPILSRIYLSSS